jgi:hypothetical protein
MRYFFSVIFFFGFAALASQTEIPLAISQNINSPFLTGKATLKFLGLKVYDITLWSENLQFSYNRKFAIHIRYNMSFSKQDLAQRSIDEIKNLHQLSQEEEKKYYQKLTEIFSDIKKDDEKIAFFDPQTGVTLFHNNQKRGEISDLKFARLFVDIWLDKKGSYPKVTEKLLGQSEENS